MVAKTSYERIGGRTRDNLPMAIFGERVCHLSLKTNRRDKSKLERMREGIWLGMRMRTNEALIGTPAGVVKARTIRILPEDKWSAAMILEVRGTPRRPNHLVDDDNVLRTSMKSHLIIEDTTIETRNMKARRVKSLSHGETPGCPGCKSIGEKNGPSHSTECRQRLQNEMSSTREGKIRLDEE